jgi:replicative DNA helicase
VAPDEKAVESCIKLVSYRFLQESLSEADAEFAQKNDVVGLVNKADEIFKISKKILSNLDENPIVDFSGKEDIENFIKNRQEEGKNLKRHLIDTGIEIIEKQMRTRKGTVNSFLGRTKVGKSIVLSNLAFGAFRKGYNVLLIALENAIAQVLTRLYSRAGYVNYKKLRNWSFDKVSEKEVMDRLEAYRLHGAKNQGRLYVHKGEPHKMDTNDIEALLSKIFERTGHRIDLVVLDYIQIFSSNKIKRSEGAEDWKIHEQIAWDLKNMAIEFKYQKSDPQNNLAVWSALQTNRGAWSKEKGATDIKDISISHIAGGYNIIPALDNLMIINQSEGDKIDNVLRLINSISRDDASSSDDGSFSINCSFDTMMINKYDTDFIWADKHRPPTII